MWNFVARIFATPDTMGKVVDAAVAAGDKIWYTDEEKAERSVVMADWYLKYLNATQPQALSRRVLTMAITFMWLFLLILSVTFGIAQGSGEGTTADYIYKMMRDVVDRPFSAVVIFYFGGHYLKEVLDARKKS